ncbi:MAG: hemerythrin domain-containing protein [Syntrophaceae bacterium]
MKPIGPLMWEHRLIDKLVQVLKTEISNIRGQNAINIMLVDEAIDFFRTYSDRTHHGKEEEILFRDLAKKPLAPEHKKTMEELIGEHVQARKMVRELIEAKETYLAGPERGLAEIDDCLSRLVEFYPRHIFKEDKNFFFPCLDYFSREEQDKMLQEFREFDRQMIHEKYTKLVEEFLGKKVPRQGMVK